MGEAGRKTVQVLHGVRDQAAGLSGSIFSGTVYGDCEGIVNSGLIDDAIAILVLCW